MSPVAALRYALLLVVGFVLGMVALGAMMGTSAKEAFVRTFGVHTAHADSLASANACTLPQQDPKDIYFVSCGGFF